MKRPAILQFLSTDAAGGVILAACAVLALVIANSGLQPLYQKILHLPLPIVAGPIDVHLDLQEWIKDGLMAAFFFVVGLELKRELLVGELSDPRMVVLPVVAAVAGMILPGATYLMLNAGGDLRGWPVPVATDIAFAVAALAILAPNTPASLRIFLLTLAVVDDLGAVVLIALLFSKDLSLAPVLCLALTLGAMLTVSRWHRAPLWLYGLGALIAWLFALKSGIHTSVAGVAAALTVPLGQGENGALERLERMLHPFSAYVVMPLFALAAAGVPLTGLSGGAMVSPVPLGIMAGLALGKPVGVLLAMFGLAKLRLAPMPAGASTAQMIGVACLCGIGFTMSLFLGGLAFAGDPVVEMQARLGVLLGSVLALLFGAIAFGFGGRK